jgi:hypothetical protein
MADPYITYPTAQNANITFPIAPIVPTLTAGTNTTQAASTGFVQNATTALLSATNTWTGLQTFNNGMNSNTVNPTAGGTLTIGNAAANTNVEIATSVGRNVVLHLGDGNNSTGDIHIGNGSNTSGNVNILNGPGSTGTITLGSATSTTSLGCPMTPAYLYPIASGKIGEVIAVSTFTPVTFSSNVPIQISSLTGLAVGTWLFTSTVVRGAAGAGNYLIQAISTTTADVTSANCFAIEYMGTATAYGLTTSISAIVQSTGTSTIYYLNGQTASGGPTTLTPLIYRAVRIA